MGDPLCEKASKRNSKNLGAPDEHHLLPWMTYKLQSLLQSLPLLKYQHGEEQDADVEGVKLWSDNVRQVCESPSPDIHLMYSVDQEKFKNPFDWRRNCPALRGRSMLLLIVIMVTMAMIMMNTRKGRRH